MAEEQSFREFLAFVDAALAPDGNVDVADAKRRLQNAMPDFLNLLQQKAPNAAARQQVQSRQPQLPDPRGRIQLDEEPDVREVLLMSDELKVDEMECLLCLLAGQEERGEVSAEVAAGVYLLERRALLAALRRLLQAAAAAPVAAEAGMTEAVAAFVGKLLDQRRDGRPALVARLLTLVQESASAGVDPGSRLQSVVDEHGASVPRADVLARERTLLLECLALAVALQPRGLAAADVAILADLAAGLAGHAAAARADVTAQQHAYVTHIALLAALLPLENAEGADMEADEQALAALAGDAELARRLEGASAPEGGPAASARLAWGLLLAQVGPETAQERAAKAIRQAMGAGALAWLDASVLRSVPFADDDAAQRELYAATIHQLLMLLLDAAAGREEIEELIAESLARVDRPPRDAMASPVAERDDLAALLSALAAVYEVAPQLWLDPELRYPILGEFMGYIAGGEVVNVAPPVFCAYMGVLTALATTEAGAQNMYAQLRTGGAAGSMVSWRRMFDFLLSICQLYSDIEADTRGVGLQAVIQRDVKVLSEADTQAVMAYLRLFGKVMGEGGDAAVGWVRQLGQESGIEPLWEVLFQLAAHPVPQEVKGAAWSAIAACAHRPEAAAAAWERLLQETVLTAPGSEQALTVAIPNYDMTYQLNEIEARAEDYTETLAFVRLLNTLLVATGDGPLPDDGRSAAVFARHVRRDVLAAIGQRAHKNASQKWELVAECARHLRLVLRRVPLEAQQPLRLAAHGGPDTSNAPGTEALLDMLGPRGGMRAVLAALSPGVASLAAARRDAAEGAAREAAALECLRLLAAGFGADVPLVQRLRSAEAGLYQTLEQVLAADPRLIAQLLGYVRYAFNPGVQAAALRVAGHLSARLPDLIPLLAGAGASAQELIDGFAGCLADALSPSSPFLPADDEDETFSAFGGSGGGGGDMSSPAEDADADVRAALVLRLLLDSVGGGGATGPALGHLLLGFDVANGPAGLAQSVLDPRQQFSCLSVVLAAVAQPEPLAARRPALYDAMLRLLAALAADPATAEPTLQLLRSQYDGLAPLVPAVVCAPLPEQDAARTASLQQRASALRLLATQLHQADAAVPLQRSSTRTLLAALFSPPAEDGADTTDEPPRNAALVLLRGLAAAADTPEMATTAAPVVRRAQLAMGIMDVLGSAADVAAGGVRTHGEGGVSLFDIPALAAVLRDRYNTQAAGGGSAAAPAHVMQEACRAALVFAQRFNAFALSGGALAALTRAWQAVVEVAFSKRFGLLRAVVEPSAGEGADDAAPGWPGGGVGLLLSTLEETLAALDWMLHGGDSRLAPPLCQVVRTLLSCVRQQAAAFSLLEDAEGAEPMAQRLLGVADNLMKAATAARRQPAARAPLAGGLLQLLALAQGGPAAGLSPASVQALLEGPSVDQAAAVAPAAALDALRSALEAGLPPLLRRHIGLVDMLVADAMSAGAAGQVGRATALTLLGALAAADDSSAVADRIHAASLPGRLLQELADTPPSAVLGQFPRGPRAALPVLEASLRLLLRLAAPEADGSPAPAHRLFVLSAIPRLAQCRLLDVEFEALDVAPSELRTRLHQVVAPALQVVLSLTAQLPESVPVRGQAVDFVERHAVGLSRILDDASDGRRMLGSVGIALEEAALVTALISRLLPRLADSHAWGRLQPGVFRLAWLYGRLDARIRDPALVAAMRRGVAAAPPQPQLGALVPYGGDSAAAAPQPSPALAAEARGIRRGVRRLRAVLADVLRQLASDPEAPLDYSAQPHAADAPPPARPPTLPLLRETLSQATEDLYAALDARQQLLAAPAPGGDVLAAAALAEADVAQGLLLIQNALAAILAVLQRNEPATKLGDERELDQLRRLLGPPLDALIRLSPEEGVLSVDVEAVHLLARRVKDLAIRL